MVYLSKNSNDKMKSRLSHEQISFIKIRADELSEGQRPSPATTTGANVMALSFLDLTSGGQEWPHAACSLGKESNAPYQESHLSVLPTFLCFSGSI